MDPDSPPPRVSVVIPTYNRALMVGEAIESVLAQTFADFELLVVDDGSTDDTAGVVEKRFGHEPRIRYLTKENGGTADARELGLDHARADLLALLDSDDRYLPRFLESQVAFLDARPEVDLALCDARREGDWVGYADTVFGEPRWRTPDSIEAMALAAWALPSSILIRTEVARRLGFRSDFSCSEDTDFLWRFQVEGFRLAENPEVLTLYFRHAGDRGEAQKIDDRVAVDEDRLGMLEKYSAHLPRSRDVRCAIHRLNAERHLRRGEKAAARRRYWKWWLSKPDSSKALRGLLRSVFS